MNRLQDFGCKIPDVRGVPGWAGPVPACHHHDAAHDAVRNVHLEVGGERREQLLHEEAWADVLVPRLALGVAARVRPVLQRRTPDPFPVVVDVQPFE
eukprot:scaffold39203_cov74-Phaeocystis_antarctica.AAC.2